MAQHSGVAVCCKGRACGAMFTDLVYTVQRCSAHISLLSAKVGMPRTGTQRTAHAHPCLAARDRTARMTAGFKELAGRTQMAIRFRHCKLGNGLLMLAKKLEVLNAE